MALGILDLIDADRRDRAQLPVLDPPLHDILDRLADLVPGRAKRHRGLLPRQLPRPVRQEQHVGLGQLVLADAPGHRFDPHPAAAAIDSAHAIEQHHHAAPQRHELEPAQLQVIIGRRRLMTARTNRSRAAARPHGDLDGLAWCAMPRALVNETGKVLVVVQQGDQPHDSRTQGSCREA